MTTQLPLEAFTPKSNWLPPKDFPNLSGVKTIGLDIESHDPNIKEMGPGFIRGDAKVVGISLATIDNAWYFPFDHAGGGNLPRESVVRFFTDLLRRDDLYVTGANLQYELEGLDSLGIQILGRLVDVQIAEPLINEELPTYNLESLCLGYLAQGKDESLLREAAAAYGVDPKSGLWKLHSRYVGPYAEFDAISCVQILPKQLEELKRQGLLPIFEMESKLLPLIWKMRKQGVPVDVDAAKKFRDELGDLEADMRVKFLKEYGSKIDEWSGPMIASLCDHKKIIYPKTPKGNPSFTGDFLESSSVPMLRDIAELRSINRLRGTFIEDWILKYAINGRVHPQWRQLASEAGGTRTGRMAAANPNPQQVPARSELSPRLRALFRNDKWAKLDYSQQEPRLLIHYAHIMNLTGASEIRDAYIANPKMDIYQYLADSCGMTRRDSKDATLGRMYGMGKRKFAGKQGISEMEADTKLREFDSKVPFVKELSDMCMNLADTRGYIKTLCGRRRHFTLYEPVEKLDYAYLGVPLSQARINWPNMRLKRAYTYKALNALIQGSAADMTKAAMLSIYEKTGKVPFMAVHDELNYGVTSEAEAQHLKELCENCVEITVPIRADLSYGDHWK